MNQENLSWMLGRDYRHIEKYKAVFPAHNSLRVYQYDTDVLTMDFRPKRLNIGLRGNIVVKAEFG